MKINSKILKIVTLLYIFLPVILFFSTWFKWYIRIPLVISILVCFFLILKGNKENNFIIPKMGLTVIVIVSLFIIFIAGIGKLSFQASYFPDNVIRNTIYKNLVFNSWPVEYADNVYLCYYIGQWLVPAFIGKIINFFLHDESLVYFISNILLYLWCAFGIIILYMNIVKYFKAKSNKKVIFIAFSFLLFAGLDVLGALLLHHNLGDEFLCGFEWWTWTSDVSAGFWQYSSFTSLIFYAFNQTIVPLLITILVFDNNYRKNSILLIIIGLLFGPYPMLGLTGYMFFKEICYSIINKTITNIIKYISVQNIVSILIFLPVLILYFYSNSKVLNPYDFSIHHNEVSIYTYILFITFEFALYILAILKTNLKWNINLIILFILLSVIPFKLNPDFVMRVSVPLLFILWINIIMFLFDNNKKIRKYLLLLLLLIGTLSPIREIKYNLSMLIDQHSLGSSLEESRLSSMDIYYRNNYISDNKRGVLNKIMSAGDKDEECYYK